MDAAAEDRLHLSLGPLSSAGAVAWTTNTLELLDALAACPSLPFTVPVEMLDTYRRVLSGLQRLAEGGTTFRWECEATLDQLRPICTYWVNIGNLSDEAIAALGQEWASPAGEQFHTELLGALLDELDGLDPAFAARLRRTWQASSPKHTSSAEV